jgi:hypothetical protein
MNTRTGALMLSLLALALPVRSQELPALIVDIGILGGPRMVRPHPPSSLSLGVEMSRSAYYKLLRGKEVLDAGLMNSGFNAITLDVTDYFEMSEEHAYVLELKSGETLYRHELILDIQLDQGSEEPAAEQEEAPAPSVLEREYTISLYVEQQLVAASRKRSMGSISFSLKLPPMPHNYDPFNPDAGRDPMANSFSILSVVGLAAHLASRLLRKDEPSSPTNPLRPLRQIQVTFSQRTPQGLEKPVSATVTLAIEDKNTKVPAQFHFW